jgi:hypothetical protein
MLSDSDQHFRRTAACFLWDTDVSSYIANYAEPYSTWHEFQYKSFYNPEASNSELSEYTFFVYI